MWVVALISLLVPSTAPAGTQPASIETVEALLHADRREEALAAFCRITDVGLSDRAIELRVKINRAADDLLDQAETLLREGKHADATELLSRLQTSMSGLPTASLARQRLSELYARPEVQAQLKVHERQAQAAEALAEARRLRHEDQEESAYRAFKQVAADYADTPAGRAAADAVKAYDADPAFIHRQQERTIAPQARAALSLAENYVAADRADLAKKKYEEVIGLFPGTSFAKTAKQRLDSLK